MRIERRSFARWLSLACCLVFALVASRARAETLAAPAAAAPIALGADRVVCRDSLVGSGWVADADAHSVRPPAHADTFGETVTARVAPNESACSTSTSTVELIVIGPRPNADLASVIVDVDAGRATVRGQRLRGAVLAWSAAGKHGSDVCTSPEVAQAVETCAFALPRDLPADPGDIELALLPPGVRAPTETKLFDASGRHVNASDSALRIGQLVLTSLVPSDVSVDVSSGTARVPMLHTEAIGATDCVDATCRMDGHDLVVRGEHGSDDKLDVHVQLRPHVVFRSGTTIDATPSITIPLQRCPLALASAPPLAGLTEQRVVMSIGGSCARESGDLTVVTPMGSGIVERTESAGHYRYAVVRVPRVDAEVLPLSLRRRGTIVGSALVSPRRLPAQRARIEIPSHGSIDFIPTNRWAKIILPQAPPGGSLEVIPVEGAYDVRHESDGAWIRGADGATGAASIRFAYVDRSLPDALKGIALAEVTEPVDRSLHPANVPVPLGALARSARPLAEVLCGDGEGHSKSVTPEVTGYIPYRSRDTCQVILHGERLESEDGAQSFQLSISITSSDGGARNEARIDRRLVLKRSPNPTYVAIAGASAPFDRILVRLAVSDDETHYVEHAAEQGSAAVQWSIVTGTDHVRLYGTAAIPTGLFRVADTGHSGILTLSVGALIRAVVLSKEGTEFPLGLEAGAMWLGIAGDTDPAAGSRGAVALVAGPGISVPIANVGHSTQTSIALHAWFEYEVSRTVLGQSGQPFGFVFGPSISIGDVGANL